MKKAQYFITCHELAMRTVNELTPENVRHILIQKKGKQFDDRQLTFQFRD